MKKKMKNCNKSFLIMKNKQKNIRKTQTNYKNYKN